MSLVRNRRGGVGIRGVIPGGLLAPGRDTEAPTVPANLAASAITATTLTLTWDASTDNVGVTEYEVQQRLASGVNGDYVTIATVAAPTVTLAVTGLTDNTEYRFRVRARDAAGNVSAWGPDIDGLWAMSFGFRAPSFSSANSNTQSDIVKTSDGWFIAGTVGRSITDANGTHSFEGLRKLNTAGAVVTAFAPVFNDTVHAIALDESNGWLVVVGAFTQVTISGVPTTRNRVCRFNLGTLALDGWNPNVKATVYTCAIDTANSNAVVIGGLFSLSNSVGTATRNRCARISRTTGVADSFNPNVATSDVNCLILTATDAFIFGGFSMVGASTRPRVCKVGLATGAVVVAFNANAGTGSLTSLYRTGSYVSGGKLYLADGSGTTYSGTGRPGVGSVDSTTGALNETFNPSSSSTAATGIAKYGSKALVATAAATIGGLINPRIVLLDETTGSALPPNPTVGVTSITCVLPIGGRSFTVDGQNMYCFTTNTAGTLAGDRFITKGDYFAVVRLPPAT
jgi:hypothetical protein